MLRNNGLLRLPSIVGETDLGSLTKQQDTFNRDVLAMVESLVASTTKAGVMPQIVTTLEHNVQAGQLVHVNPNNVAVLAVNNVINRWANAVVQTVMGNGKLLVAGIGKYPVKCKPFKSVNESRLFLSDIPGWAMDTEPIQDYDNPTEPLYRQQIGYKIAERDNLSLCVSEVRFDEYVLL